MTIKSQEMFNFYSHFLGGIAAFIGTLFLIAITQNASAVVTALVYGISVVFLFSASSLYHAFKKEENEISFWRKMDRLAIFFMIAGSYTPVCYFFLDESWKWPMIAIQWLLVGFGVFTQIFFPRAPRKIYVAMYLTMGWLLILPINQVIDAMTSFQVTMLFSGAAAFTLGALVYGAKKPLLIPGKFSFHELFHVFVLLGGGFHYAMIYSAYQNAAI